MSDDMNNHEEHHEENPMEETPTAAPAPMTAEEYVSQELATAKKGLVGTQVYGSIFVLAVACVLGGIGHGFASNLSPKEAAKITKGLVMQRLDDLQTQASTYLKKQIPQFIEQAPDWAMARLPEYRNSLEDKLETQFTNFAHETSGKLDTTFDSFIDENQDQFKTIILAGQDKETTDAVAAHLRDSFMTYLTEPGEDGESVQDKFDKSLEMLQEIEQKTHYLAFGKDLNPTDLKTRRALAVLFGTITENRDLMPIPSKGDIQDAISSNLPESAEPTAEGEEPAAGTDTPAASAPALKGRSAASHVTMGGPSIAKAPAAAAFGAQHTRASGPSVSKITTPVVIGAQHGLKSGRPTPAKAPATNRLTLGKGYAGSVWTGSSQAPKVTPGGHRPTPARPTGTTSKPHTSGTHAAAPGRPLSAGAPSKKTDKG